MDFLSLRMLKVPDSIEVRVGGKDECEGLCLGNCSCIAYSHDPGIGCMFWRNSLIDVRQYYPSGGSDLYVRVAYSVLGTSFSYKLVCIPLFMAICPNPIHSCFVDRTLDLFLCFRRAKGPKSDHHSPSDCWIDSYIHLHSCFLVVED